MEAKKLVIFVFKILAEPVGQKVWLTTVKFVLHFEGKNRKIRGVYSNEVYNLRNGTRI